MTLPPWRRRVVLVHIEREWRSVQVPTTHYARKFGDVPGVFLDALRERLGLAPMHQIQDDGGAQL